MKRLLIISILFLSSCLNKFTYEDAERRGTIDAYYRFVTENPDSPEVEQAISKIKDMLFAMAVEKRDILLIKRFISEFPSDPRVEILKNLLEELRFAEAKKRNTRISYEIFIRTTENERLRREARSILEEIEYNEVGDTSDIEKLEGFLSRHRESPHFSELNERLYKLLLARLKDGDYLYAGSIIRRFPDADSDFEITYILLDDISKRLSRYCITDGFEDIIIRLKNRELKDNIKGLINEIEGWIYRCREEEREFNKIVDGEKGGLFKGLSNKKIDEVRKTFRQYKSTIASIREMGEALLSEDPVKRRDAYYYLKRFPLSLRTARALIDAFINSTTFERIELANIIRERLQDDTDKRIFNFLFFINRDRPLYSIIRGLFFEPLSDFESANSFLNSSYPLLKEDVFLQFLLIEEAYKRGYNSFIKSVINEHIKDLFLHLSAIQSMCQETCPAKLLYELSGTQKILEKELEISKIIANEDSDIYKILKEKEGEISKILARYKPDLSPPAANYHIEPFQDEILQRLRGKGIVRFLYQAEESREGRERLKSLIPPEDKAY